MASTRGFALSDDRQPQDHAPGDSMGDDDTTVIKL
jgi:hypothetical protein